ncbi:MAG TPA: hypothetical protein VKB88_04695 [Bryobacteraceae bacterium]|nr:hypothetical protein [Bryobacteraceae bacterium]
MAANIEEAIGIDEARARFEHWRKSRSGKARIPDELWSMAVSAARLEGVNRTAQQLHLDGGKLKQLLVAADGGQRQRRRRPEFVELISTVPAADPACVIEFESASGSKMRIHWKTAAPLDWLGLLRAWRDAER